jgi:hypothetical protein
MHARRCLLAVTDQDLIAGFADSRPVALQAVENADKVVVGVFDDLLTKALTSGRQAARSLASPWP